MVPAGYEFVRFETTGGVASVSAIAPNGRRAQGTLVIPDADRKRVPGNHQLGIVVRSVKQASSERIKTLPFTIEASSKTRCMQSPCSTPPPPQCVPVQRQQQSPCTYRRLTIKGALRFADTDKLQAQGWPQTIGLDIGVSTKLSRRFELAQVPTATCSTGTVNVFENSRQRPRRSGAPT